MREGEAATIAREDAGLPIATRCGPAVRAYIETVCGRHVRSGVIDAALLRISEIPGGPVMTPHVAEIARQIAREAALVEARRSARSVGPRLRHVLRGRRGHAKVPGLLLRRSIGLISAPDLNWLYSALGGCVSCGELATRLDDAEWRLSLALTEIAQGASVFDADEPDEMPAAELEPAVAADAPPASTRPEAGVAGGPQAPDAAPGPRRGLGRFPVVLAVVLVGGGCTVTLIEIFHGQSAGARPSSASAALDAILTPTSIAPGSESRGPRSATFARPDRKPVEDPPAWIIE